MFTEEQLAQLRSVIREEVEAESAQTRREATFANVHLKAGLSAINGRLKTVEIDTKRTREAVMTLAQKLDTAQKETGELLHEILDTVGEHHTKLTRRVERIEEHLGLPEHR